MSLQKKLHEKIKTDYYCSRDELRQFAEGYDTATCDRKLRALTEQGSIKPKFGSKGFIVGYYYQGVEQAKTNDDFYEMFQEEMTKQRGQAKLI